MDVPDSVVSWSVHQSDECAEPNSQGSRLAESEME